MTFVRFTAALLLAPLLHLPLAALPGTGARAQDAMAEGERLFRSRCGSCHSTEPGQNRIGPHLAGVVGRAAGTLEGARYSQALRAAGLTWDVATLDRYLANPRQAVPGTTMTVALRDDAQRAAVIVFLQSLPAANAPQ